MVIFLFVCLLLREWEVCVCVGVYIRVCGDGPRWTLQTSYFMSGSRFVCPLSVQGCLTSVGELERSCRRGVGK